MRFEEVLQQQKPFPPLGGFHFSYEQSVLIAERRVRRSPWGGLLWQGVALAGGLGTVVLALLPQRGFPWGALLCAFGVVAAALGSGFRHRNAPPRAFAVNFPEELIRVEPAPRGFLRPGGVRVIPFDAVAEVRLWEGEVELVLRSLGEPVVTLISRLKPYQSEEGERLVKFLRRALGL